MEARPAVLLVDEHGSPQITGMLARCGFAVTSVATAEAAGREYGRRRPDAVVISMSLPGTGAVALCRELRGRGRTPLLVVSATDDADWLGALDAGADDHVPVPCDERVLRARLLALIRRAGGSWRVR